jgi:hypothetical protein
MSTYIIYCRECNPKKALAVSTDPAQPMDAEGAVHGTHTNCGLLTIDSDPQQEGESVDQYFSRLESTYQAQFT